MIDKIIQLLINAGLRKDDCVELAEKINRLYEELEHERRSKGGRAKVPKGFAVMKRDNPEKFKKMLANRKNKKA